MPEQREQRVLQRGAPLAPASAERRQPPRFELDDEDLGDDEGDESEDEGDDEGDESEDDSDDTDEGDEA